MAFDGSTQLLRIRGIVKYGRAPKISTHFTSLRKVDRNHWRGESTRVLSGRVKVTESNREQINLADMPGLLVHPKTTDGKVLWDVVLLKVIYLKVRVHLAQRTTQNYLWESTMDPLVVVLVLLNLGRLIYWVCTKSTSSDPNLLSQFVSKDDMLD